MSLGPPSVLVLRFVLCSRKGVGDGKRVLVATQVPNPLLTHTALVSDSHNHTQRTSEAGGRGSPVLR